MGGVIAGIIVLVWLVRRAGGGGAGHGVESYRAGIQRADRRSAIVWIVFALASVIALVAQWTTGLAVLGLLLVTILQPALWARLAIARGWVVPAYRLGRWTVWVNRRSVHGGALFYGWCALQQHAVGSPAFRQGMAFLEQKLQGHPGQADSGVLLMQVLMQQHRLPAQRFYRRLFAARFLDTRCIPEAMARHAFRLTAAHALADGQWKELSAAAHYWRRHSRVPLADLLDAHYQRHGGKSRLAPPPLQRRVERQPDWIHRLPPVTPAGPPPLPPVGEEGLHRRTWQLGPAAAPPSLVSAWQASFEAPTRQQQWAARAQELGCSDPQRAIDAIRTSLEDWRQSQSSARAAAGSDVAVDHLFETLHFKTRAINARVEGSALLAASVEHEEFLGLMEAFEQLSGDPLQKHQAYTVFENAVWNWMAELWNVRKEPWLAYYICSRLYDYANSIGSRAAGVYREILTGEVC